MTEAKLTSANDPNFGVKLGDAIFLICDEPEGTELHDRFKETQTFLAGRMAEQNIRVEIVTSDEFRQYSVKFNEYTLPAFSIAEALKMQIEINALEKFPEVYLDEEKQQARLGWVTKKKCKQTNYKHNATTKFMRTTLRRRR